MSDGRTDAELVACVLEGDVDAFGVLVDRYQDEFAAYANYMTGSADDAADIIQESLIRAYRSLKRCKDPHRFKGWLFRIVSNQCKTYLARRKRRRTDPMETIDSDIPAVEEADAEVEAAERRRVIEEALQQLPVDQREALVMRYVYGLSLSEMTEALDASVSAVKMRLQRGRGALRAQLEGGTS